MNEILRKALDAKLLNLGVDWLRIESLVVRAPDRSIFAAVDLDGETELVELTMLYQLEGDELIVENVESSKVWISRSIALVLTSKGNRIKLPSGLAGKTIRMML